MKQLFVNNFATALVGAVAAGDGILSVASASGLPTPGAGEYFLLTLIGLDANGNEVLWEVVKVTASAGNALTVARGQEGTNARAWPDGTLVESRLTAGGMDSKEDAIAAGTTGQYWRGDKTWSNFYATVRASTLDGLSTATNATITATDTVLSALGKLQKQISDAATNLAGSVRATVLTGYAVGSTAALAATDTILSAFGKVQAQLDAKLPLSGGNLTGPLSASGHITTSGYSIVSGSNANYNFGMLHDSNGMLNLSRVTKAGVWSASLLWISDTGQVYANAFNGTLNGNAASATTLAGDQTNWANYRNNAVANMLGWKKFGNGHVIFDASAGTAPNGTAKSNTHADVDWVAGNPTLMGWNGSSTYGVRVARAAQAEKCVDTGWITLSLINGFSHGFNTLQIRRVGNIVYLQGQVYRATPPGGLTGFSTVPAGYRPTKGVSLAVPMNADNFNWVIADIGVGTDGGVGLGLTGVPSQNNAYWSINASWVTDYA